MFHLILDWIRTPFSFKVRDKRMLALRLGVCLLVVVHWMIKAEVIYCSSTEEIQAAMRTAMPGDEVVIAPGTYVASSVYDAGHFTALNNGTADEPIVVRSEDAQNPATLIGADISKWYVVRVLGDHWVLKDLKMTNAQKGIMLDSSSFAHVLNCEVYNIGFECVHIRDGSDFVTIEQTHIHDCGKVNKGYGEGIYIGSDKTQWDTWAHDVYYATVRNCTIGPNITAEILDIKEGTTDTTIEFNTFDATGLSGEHNADSFIDLKGQRSHVRYNTFHRNGAAALTKGVAIVNRQIEEFSSFEHVIHNNKFFLDGVSSILMVNAAAGTRDIWAWDNENDSGGTYSSIVQTECCPPWYTPPIGCPAPKETEATTRETSIEIGWNQVSGALFYFVEVKELGDSTPLAVYSADINSFDISYLDPDTHYIVRLQTVCSYTESSWSTEESIWTLPSSSYCDDSLSFRFEDDGLERSCGYIRYYRQDLVPILCVPGNPVNEYCVESCGNCSDDCNEDPTAPVYINDFYGTKSCKWVAASHYRVAEFCNTDFPSVWQSCAETCENCGAPSSGPTESPTLNPTLSPAGNPTVAPTESPPLSSSVTPSVTPTDKPTDSSFDSSSAYPSRTPWGITWWRNMALSLSSLEPSSHAFSYPAQSLTTALWLLSMFLI